MILLIIYTLLTSIGLILFKLGSENINFSFTEGLLKGQISIISVLGLCCYVFSFILSMIVFAKAEKLSTILPISVALTQILVMVLSYFILKEQISYNTIISIALLVLAIYFGQR